MMRIARWFLASAATLILLGALALWLAMRASLPKLDGNAELTGLSASATIERDSAGTPTIKASTRADLAFATGYAHAQDRFFQMDMMRRAAAGELAEMLGPPLIDTDKRFRTHGFRQLARQIVADAPATDRAILQSYVDGVNAGLHELGSRPWEYLVLASAPAAWRIEDSLLAAFSMYLNLNDSSGEEELAREYLRETLPAELFAFLHPLGTEWDAPLAGGVWRTPSIPSADVFDMRRLASDVARFWPPSRLEVEQPDVVGSNSWAVAATHSGTGAALLANDMHLGLRLPNTWYRARLVVTTGPEARDLIGVTLPGLPMLIAGSNRQVAWGFTNSYGDWTDLVIVAMDPQRPAHYLVGHGAQPVGTRREEIKVRGAASVIFAVNTTRWGPIVQRDAQNRPLALAWTAHHRNATNLRMLDFESARNVDELLNSANSAGGPVQNVIAADAAGAIGWSLLGRVPIRANYDATRPSSWRAAGTGWVGWREPSEYPRIIDPPMGRLWTANTRTIDAQTWVDFLGDGGHDLGARAQQIRDSLLALPSPTAADFVKMQSDDRALFLVRWRDLLLELLNEEAVSRSPTRAQARQLIENWSARASVDDVGYRIVRAFRLQMRKEVFDAFTSAARSKHPAVRFAPSPQFEGPLWQLVTERPAHLLDPGHANWESAMLTALDEVLRDMQSECHDLAVCTWGRQNVLQMRHPLATALPFANRWLDMRAQALPGDAAMPRVQGAQFGASQRLVVSPGHEDEGVFQMPGGPVDHPLSPFYGAGHDAWARGEPQPLLPGPPLHRLQLAPRP
jgi:penicillin G amidase